MTRIQRLAVIGVDTSAHYCAAAITQFQEPIGIGQRPERETNDVRRAFAR